MIDWPLERWRAIVDASPEGIVVYDGAAGYPVLYANRVFAQMCGRAPETLIGIELRELHGGDPDQEGCQRVREALEQGQPCRALLRNGRPDGTLFWNELLLQPVYDETGRATHWIGYHRDAGERVRSPERAVQGLPAWMREDRLTSLSSRAYFEEILRRDWQVAQRDSHEIALALFDIDDLTAYNDTFDKAAGDACIRRVARAIASSYRRGSDLVGRWSGGTFAVLTQGDAAVKSCDYAKLVVQRARDLLIHHPRAGGGSRYVTLSAGVASLVPARDLPLEALIGACLAALQRAKEIGKNNLCAAEARDFKR